MRVCSKSRLVGTYLVRESSFNSNFGGGINFCGSIGSDGFVAANACCSFASLAASFLYSSGSHVNVNSSLLFGSGPKSHKPMSIFVFGGSHLLFPSHFT